MFRSKPMIEPIHPTDFVLRVKNRDWPLRCRPSASPTPVFVVASKPKPHWQEISFTSSQVTGINQKANWYLKLFGLMEPRLIYPPDGMFRSNPMTEPIHPTGFALRVKNRDWPLRCRPAASPTPVFVVTSKPKPHWQEIGFTSNQVTKLKYIGHGSKSNLVLIGVRLNPIEKSRYPDQTCHRVDKSATSNGRHYRFFHGVGIAPVIGSASLHQSQATTSAHRKNLSGGEASKAMMKNQFP